MCTTSTPAVADPAASGPPDSPALLVFDSYVAGKRLVTAVVLSCNAEPARARLAKRTRDAALRHQRLLGTGTGAHLVQPFDAEGPGDRVASVLAVARPGALVILFGRTTQECDRIVQALGVHVLSAEDTGLQ